MLPSPTALLSPDWVLLDLNANEEAAAIRAVAGVFAGHPEVTNPTKLADEVIDRERLSSTALGYGVGFPHARTALVKEIVVAVGRSAAGVLFTGNKDPVHFLFVIGAPPDRAAPYLALVARLARLLKNEAVRSQLMAASDADAFLNVLQSGG